MDEAFEEWLKTYQGLTYTGYINRKEAVEIFNAGYVAGWNDRARDIGEPDTVDNFI